MNIFTPFPPSKLDRLKSFYAEAKDSFAPFYFKIWIWFFLLSGALHLCFRDQAAFKYIFYAIAAIGLPLYIVIGGILAMVAGVFYAVIGLICLTAPFSLYLLPFAVLGYVLWAMKRSREDAQVTHPSQILRSNPGSILHRRRR